MSEPQPQNENGESSVLAKRLNVIDFRGKYAIRNVEGPRACLNWQIGIIEQERRRYQDPGMFSVFDATVSVFHLLGHGASLQEAIAMAKGRK